MKKLVFSLFTIFYTLNCFSFEIPEVECTDYKAGRGTLYVLHYLNDAPIELAKQADYMKGKGIKCEYLNMAVEIIFEKYSSNEFIISCNKEDKGKVINVSDKNNNKVDSFSPYPVSDNKNFCEALVNEINRIIDADFRQTIEEEVEESLSTLGNINSGDCPKSERP
ncbi:MAG: hypothetical protein KC506_04020 [Nanoarchaeota archaeon]|nr:hypothetical protein [Nanoarchaeota archaeon]